MGSLWWVLALVLCCWGLLDVVAERSGYLGARNPLRLREQYMLYWWRVEGLNANVLLLLLCGWCVQVGLLGRADLVSDAGWLCTVAIGIRLGYLLVGSVGGGSGQVFPWGVWLACLAWEVVWGSRGDAWWLGGLGLWVWGCDWVATRYAVRHLKMRGVWELEKSGG